MDVVLVEREGVGAKGPEPTKRTRSDTSYPDAPVPDDPCYQGLARIVKEKPEDLLPPIESYRVVSPLLSPYVI